MSVTRLGSFGIGLGAYAGFAPKTEAAPEHNAVLVTRLSQMGFGLSRYGTFSPKTEATPEVATNEEHYQPILTIGRLNSR